MEIRSSLRRTMHNAEEREKVLDYFHNCVMLLKAYNEGKPSKKDNLHDKTLTAMLLFKQQNISLRSFKIVHKDINISEECRMVGNGYFKQDDFDLALRYYQMSVRYAINNSVHLSLAYANCSAACLNLELYDDCLTNIEWAKPNYPKHLQHKLNDRIKKCNESKSLLDTPNAKTSDSRLTYRCNKKIPMLAYCLEIDKKNLANGIHTTRDLKPGDIVGIETPFATCEGCYNVCSFMYCSKVFNAEIPCESCNLVGYCSKICREKAYDLYHKYECAVGFFLHCAGSCYRLALRVCLIALSKFKHISWKDYFHSLMVTPHPDEWDYKNGYDFSMHKYIFSAPIDKSIVDWDLLAVITALSAETIIPLLSAEPKINFLDSIIYHNQHILSVIRVVGHKKYNSFLLENGKVSENILLETIFLTTCGILSFLNIDSKPNVCLRLDESRKLILEVMRPIKQGEELLTDLTILPKHQILE